MSIGHKDIESKKQKNIKIVMMKRKKKSIAGKAVIFIAMLSLLLLFGCQNNQGNPAVVDDPASTGFYLSAPGNYDSADTAIVIKKNTAAGTITFLTLQVGKKYTLNYDGATTYYDKYGQALTLAQIHEGDIVDVTFMKDRKRLNSVNMSTETFVINAVKDYQLSSKKIIIGKEEYNLSSDVVVIKGGNEGEVMDINSVDVLTVEGFGHTVNSIIVDRGHGYLRLENDSFFVGGFIEVDNDQVYQIEDEMLLAIPTGNIEITVSHAGCIGTTSLNVEDGQEYSLDVSSWQGEAKKGSIIFTVSPDQAKVLIDGKEVNISEPVELEYGIHQMNISAKGYKSISKYLKVGSDAANIDVKLEKESEETSSVSSNTTVSTNTVPAVSSNSISGNTTPGAVSNNEATEQNNSVPSQAVSDNGVSSNSVAPKDDSSNDNNETSKDAVSDNQASNVITTDQKSRVYIDGPAGVEVYVDGTYIGVAPTSFKKKTGFAVVTLRRDGYNTRSYTLELDGSDADENYSFAELTPL